MIWAHSRGTAPSLPTRNAHLSRPINDGSQAVHLVRPRISARRLTADEDERRVKTNPPPAPSHRSTTKVPFSSAADAEAVCATLSVDNELQPDKVTKKLSVEGNELVA